ncbi:hypothetical protein [Gilvimarinus japonicus]|uniref:Uncharacterized protein n=1 Tax=Gilvimarinus japonicus TaxID=1796469 RepID=A0ABV7I062_9GAMM
MTIIKASQRFIGISATFLLTAGSSSLLQAQTYFPSDVDTSLCSLTSSEFSNWVTLTLPPFAPNSAIGPVFDKDSGMPYIFPPAGPYFPKDRPDASHAQPTDCDFYKWGSQMFLWLTSTINDGTKPSGAPNYSAELPFVFNSEFFYRLSGDQTALLPQGSEASSNSDTLKVKLRTAKGDESIGQAGGNGVLLSQDKSLTYYGIHVNRLYGYFYSDYREEKADGKKPAKQFPTTATDACRNINYAMHNGYADDGLVPKTLYDLYCSSADLAQSPEESADAGPSNVAATSALTIPQLEPAVDFLSMAVEVKTSWVDASTVCHDENAACSKEDYIRQNLNVPVYDRSDDTRWAQTTSEVKELALVGMHIVGTVKGHPESIWATIEHKHNAPNGTYYYYTNKKDSENQKPVVKKVSSPQPNAKWTFSDGSLVTDVKEQAVGCTNTPMPKGCQKPSDIVSSESTSKIKPTNVTRIHPWGNKQSESDDFAISQNTQLIALNRDVNKQVGKWLSSDPRQNYFISGAVWTNNGGIPTGDDYAHNTGSKTLANTTMETFQQTKGCFGCHNSQDASNGLNVSHVFLGLTAPLPRATVDVIKQKANPTKEQ